jgi:hypothetical protein
MFDIVDYHKRQRNIRRITLTALILMFASFTVAALNLVSDANTQTVIEFLFLCSGLTVLVGLLASFIAWFEKKIEQQ